MTKYSAVTRAQVAEYQKGNGKIVTPEDAARAFLTIQPYIRPGQRRRTASVSAINHILWLARSLKG